MNPSRIWRAALIAAPLRTWAIILAAPVLTLLAIGWSLIIWLGPWAPDRQEQQIDFIGASLLVALGIIAMIIAALAGLGIAATVNKGGLSLTVGDDDHEPPAKVTTTVETTVSPGKQEGFT